MDSLEIVLAILPFIGFLGTVLYMKYMFNAEHLSNMLYEISEIIRSDTKLQNNLYGIGGIIGQGIMQGTGMKKSSGKFNMENLIGTALNFITNRNQSQQPQQTPQGENPFG